MGDSVAVTLSTSQKSYRMRTRLATRMRYVMSYRKCFYIGRYPSLRAICGMNSEVKQSEINTPHNVPHATRIRRCAKPLRIKAISRSWRPAMHPQSSRCAVQKAPSHLLQRVRDDRALRFPPLSHGRPDEPRNLFMGCGNFKIDARN